MKTIILAGGLGTRLQGVIEVPKPMAPIGAVPFLEYLLLRFKSQGCTDFILSIGHGGDKLCSYFDTGARLGVSIQYTVEEQLLGTGGAVKLAEPLLGGEDFLLANGDTYFEVDLKGMLASHQETGARATMALARREDTARYGRVTSDHQKRILSFEEKSGQSGPGYINGGVYLLGNWVLDLIPEGRVCSLEREVLPRLIGHGLYGFAVNGYFIDIGIPQDYALAQHELPARRLT